MKTSSKKSETSPAKEEWQSAVAVFVCGALAYIVCFGGEAHPENVVLLILKCLPIVSLWAAILNSRNLVTDSYSKWILFGLIFSCFGDALLIYEGYLRHGVVAFALAHVCYIIAFELHPISWTPGVVCSLLGTASYAVMRESLPELLRHFVRFYIVIIYFMTWRAVDYYRFSKGGRDKLFAVTGAIMFVISDSTLGFDRFSRGFSFANAQYVVMVSYYAAQVLLALSAVTRLIKKSAH